MLYSRIFCFGCEPRIKQAAPKPKASSEAAFAGCVLIAAMIGTVVPAPSARAQTANSCGSIDQDLLKAPYVFQYGLSGSSLQNDFFGVNTNPNDGSYNDAGYRPIRLTGYMDNGQVRFATKWVKMKGPTWNSRFGMTGAEFDARFALLKATHRIVDISAYNTPEGSRYADIWEKNPDNLAWAVKRRTPQAQMGALKADMKAKGLGPTRVEGYTFNGSIHFASVWTAVPSACDWDLEVNLTSAGYQALFDANKNTSRLIHVDSYHDNSSKGSRARYAGIWWDQGGPGLRATHVRHWYTFQRLDNNQVCDGFTVDNFYADEAATGWNYFGAIWSYNHAPNITDASSLRTRITHHVNCADGRAGAAIINETTGETVMANADQVFGTASSIKAFILFALLRKADAENIDITSKTINDTPLIDLATLMIKNSNNSATNTLIDFVGMDQVNDEIRNTLGLNVTTLGRYLSGGPSAHGLGDWFDDFKAGHDNFSTPRELVTFYQKVWANDGLLSDGARTTFFDITDQPNSIMNNVLNEQVNNFDPLHVQIWNKPGSITYTGVPGDFSHRPQLGNYKVTADAGVMRFSNDQLVFFAVIVDGADTDGTYRSISCSGWELGKQYSGQPVGNPADCAYP